MRSWAAATALASGTAALHLSLLLLGVCPGDRVLCSTLTFAASANAITYLGAEPVFMDSDRESWNLDPALLADDLRRRASAGRLPAAVVVVHVFGQSANLDPILDSCAEFDVPVIEDAAEALGTTYHGRSVGTFGRLGVFSFNGNKIITTSGGGILIAGEPASGNVVKGNRNVGGTSEIRNRANAKLESNEGYEVEKSD